MFPALKDLLETDNKLLNFVEDAAGRDWMERD